MNKISDISESSMQFLPLTTTILLLLLSYVPFSFGFDNSIRPMLALASCFFWLTHRSDIFGLFSVLTVALFSGFFSSQPLGSEILMFFCQYALVSKFERFFYNKAFISYWYGFIGFSFVAVVLKWFVLSLYYSKFLPFNDVFFMYLTTVICYPFVSLINAVIQSYVRFGDER